MPHEETSDQFNELVLRGNERGYLLIDEIKGILAATAESESVNDTISALESSGISIYEDKVAAKAAIGPESESSVTEANAEDGSGLDVLTHFLAHTRVRDRRFFAR